MKVFKFGGASVNSADAVRNMAHIVQKHLESAPLVVVVSAFGGRCLCHGQNNQLAGRTGTGHHFR